MSTERMIATLGYAGKTMATEIRSMAGKWITSHQRIMVGRTPTTIFVLFNGRTMYPKVPVASNAPSRQMGRKTGLHKTDPTEAADVDARRTVCLGVF